MKTPRAHFSALQILLGITLVLGAGNTSCSMAKKADAELAEVSSAANAASSGASFAYFADHVYPLLRTNCIACHVPLGGGPATARFASPNMDLAFRDARLQMNWSAAYNSNLVIRAGDGHCGAVGCMGNVAAQLKLVAMLWADIENAMAQQNPDPGGNTGGSGPPPVAAPPPFVPSEFGPAVLIPANIPDGQITSGQSSTLSFNLVGTAKINFQIQEFGPEIYVIHNLQIANPNPYPVSIDGIGFALNGQSIPEASNFYDFQYTAPANSSTFVNIGTGFSQILVRQVGTQNAPGADQLQFSFGTLVP
jgi:hypothetical protein